MAWRPGPHLINSWQVAVREWHSSADALDGLCNEPCHASGGACPDDIRHILRILGAIVAKGAGIWVRVEHMPDAKALSCAELTMRLRDQLLLQWLQKASVRPQLLHQVRLFQHGVRLDWAPGVR